MKLPFKIINPKKDVDEVWKDNPRYVGKEQVDRDFLYTTRMDIGFLKMMGDIHLRLKIYWFYMVNDFDITYTNPVLKDSAPSVEIITRAHMIEKYGDRYFKPLKKHLKNTQPETYDEEIERINRYLEISEKKRQNKATNLQPEYIQKDIEKE